ncbi:MAG: peptide chain release factor N(5)-glutamine methyltransferase [Firmicutes bacterium]|nr:peptide chain release factor N(5)-glutamine methyltransferase [Bacillota bacterium]
MTFRDLQTSYIERLKNGGSPCPEDEAEKIILEGFGMDRLRLFTSQRDQAPAEGLAKAEGILAERLSGRPLQYVLHRAYFMDLELYVDERVLIPRQDTELVAQTAEEWIEEKFGGAESGSALCDGKNACRGMPKPRILDLCTGSGALAVWLKHRFPGASVTASDISPKALEVSRLNANNNGCCITFVLADLFGPSASPKEDGRKENALWGPSSPDGGPAVSDCIPENSCGGTASSDDPLAGPFDLIVTNPPYIPTGDIPGLMADVRDHEPHLALDGGESGLDIVRRIIDQAPRRLAPGGLLLMEIGEGEGDAVKKLAEDRGAFTDISIRRDLNGLDRMLYCVRKEEE